MSKRPKVSVIMPSNKKTEDIIKSLSTLIDVRRTDIEYLVNLDAVPEAVEDKIKKRWPEVVKIFRESLPLAEALNFLIAESSGEYIARADDDDVYLPGRLASQAFYLDARRDVDVVGAAMYMSRGGKTVGLKLYPGHHEEIAAVSLLECHCFAHPVVMGRREFFESMRYYQIEAEDFDLWTRGLCAGFRYSNLEIPLFVYSLPSYSEEKAKKMGESVVNSSLRVIKEYYGVSDPTAHVIVRCLNQRLPACRTASSDNLEALQEFYKSLQKSGFSVRIFADAISRYDNLAGHLIREAFFG